MYDCLQLYIYVFIHTNIDITMTYTHCSVQHLLEGRGMYAEYLKHSAAAGQSHFSLEKFRQGIDEVMTACREVLDDEGYSPCMNT